METLANRRKIDVYSPIGKTSLKYLREYASAREGRQFRSITQLKKFYNMTETNVKYHLATLYNTEIDKQKKNKKVKQTYKQAAENNANYFEKLQKRNVFRDIYKNVYLLQNNRRDEFSINLEEALGVFSLKEFLGKLLNALLEANKTFLTIEVNGTFYTLNDHTRLRLLEYIENGMVQQEDVTESDGRVVTNIEYADTMTIHAFEPKHKNQRHNGAFFKYMHNMKFDLSKYGIYSVVDYSDIKRVEEINRDTCLIHALKQGGLEEQYTDAIKELVKNRCIPLSDLDKICEKAEIQIQLKKVDKNNKKDDKHNDRYVYGKQFKRVFVIGLIDEHYFLIDETNITSYAIQNYDEVKNEKEPNYIIKKQGNSYKRDKKRCIDSFKLVRLLIDNKDTLLEEISNENSLIAATQFYDRVDDKITDLNYTVNASTIKPVVQKEEEKPKKEVEFVNVFFDFETYVKHVAVNLSGVEKHRKQHTPYLCRTIDNSGIEKVFYGENCGLKMLFSLNKHTRLIAHNANYDYRFIIRHLHNVREISRGNRLISCTGLFKKLQIQIKDSLHLISMPLRDFPGAFNLRSEKEVMPYDLYNETTVNEKFVSINTALSFVKEEDRGQFLDNIKKWNLQVGDKYNIIEYSSKYCALDCSILRDGYNTFRGWMLEHVKIDINDMLTIASLAHKYFVNEGCYNGVNQLGGTPQRFIQKCVVGGRTMCADNVKHQVSGRIQDFDAVSLYPSAMYRMDGFLLGVPKVITNLDYNDLKRKDGYFVEIVIKRVGIKRTLPLISYKNDKGVRMFTNDVIGKHVFVDKITLEDIITFQDVEFDIVRGYYFDEGFNTKIKDTIKYLFEKRLELKKQKNNCEMVYKLIMNSGYGKSIMKPIENETRVINNEEEFQKYMTRNYNWIISFNRISDSEKFRVKSVKTLIDHFNIAHVGVSILSMSKRIMNEVMCLAEDNGIDIYYQDTDSMHLKEEGIDVLSNAFNEKYGRELIGKQLGQFHSDFDFHDEEGNKRNDIANIYASRSLFLGKKCYIDELKGTNKNTGEIETDYHIRMKGVPNSCILYTSKKLGFNNVYDMYESLYNGNAIDFDLTQNGKKANFKFENDYTVHTLSVFQRKIKF